MIDQPDPPRRRRPPSKRGRTQDKSRDDLIIQATLALLGEGGYHALTMTDVAVRSGVSKATLYRRWGDKADLVADTIATLDPFVPPCYPGTSLRDDLVALMQQAGNCADRPDLATATIEMARSQPNLYHTLAERFVMHIRREIDGLAEQAVEAGHSALSEPAINAISETVVALLAHQTGPGRVPISRERLIEWVDHVLLVLMTGSRNRS